MKKTCRNCSEEFELLPGKPGLATVCPRCSMPSAEQRERQAMADAQKRKSLTTSVRENAKHREEERKHDIALGRMGYKVVRRFKTRPVAEQ